MMISPPNSDPTPKWAQKLVNTANARNRNWASQEVYSMADLIAAWEGCGGCCALSGRAFDLEIVGDGQAKRPFAPSLDRIDRHKPYQKDNVRIVLAVANFAMNAWGDAPVLELASSLLKKHGEPELAATPAPSDSDLNDIAVIDDELVETDIGTLSFPPRVDLVGPLLKLLEHGPRSSRELENALAEQFGITDRMRAATYGNNYPVWRNHVAWVLVHLGPSGRGTGQVKRAEDRAAPNGGTMGIYRLVPVPSTP